MIIRLRLWSLWANQERSKISRRTCRRAKCPPPEKIWQRSPGKALLEKPREADPERQQQAEAQMELGRATECLVEHGTLRAVPDETYECPTLWQHQGKGEETHPGHHITQGQHGQHPKRHQ